MRVTTLFCAPTNNAVRLAANGVFALINKSTQSVNCSRGDILVIGSKYRLKLGKEMDDMYLEERVVRLIQLAGSWKYSTESLLSMFREDSSLIDALQNGQFSSLAKTVRNCIDSLLKDVSIRLIGDDNIQDIYSLVDQFGVFDGIVDALGDGDDADLHFISRVRSASLPLLISLHQSLTNLGLPNSSNTFEFTKFCFEKAALVLCTASTSYELHQYKHLKFDYLVVDEASQLKEAESTIPLQQPGIKHAVLVGDELQLSAMVTSKVITLLNFSFS